MSDNRYGSTYYATPRNLASLNALVAGLGVAWARPPAVISTTGTVVGRTFAADQAAALGLRVALTVRNTDGPSYPSRPPDLSWWRDWLAAVLAITPCDLLAVENEEDSQLFYDGTPDQYAAQLAVSCDMAHALGIKVTNGGITSRYAAQLALQDWPERLAIYRDSDIDWFNFHYYSDNVVGVPQLAEWLAAATGKSVISNEMGQRYTSSEWVSLILSGAESAALPVAIWYSGPGPSCYPLWSLDSFEASPRYYAFQSFMRALRIIPEVA